MVGGKNVLIDQHSTKLTQFFMNCRMLIYEKLFGLFSEYRSRYD